MIGMTTFITNSLLQPLDRVRAAREAAEEAALAYWCAIDEAVAAGHSLREVGTAGGMSHTGVAKVVDRLKREGRSRQVERVQGRWVMGEADGRAAQNLSPYELD